MKNFLKKYIDDALILAGCVLILIWVYLVWPVGTWLIGGVMSLAAGVLIGLTGGKK
jgi:hypothetical protein